MGVKSVCLAAVAALGLSSAAHASVIVNIQEGVDDVVVTYSGTVNMAALLSPKVKDAASHGLRAGKSILNIIDDYNMFRDDISSMDRGWGPTPYPSTLTDASSFSGDVFGFTNNKLYLPIGYSGSVLSGSLTFSNYSLADLQLNTGTYVATTWGDAADGTFDSVTVSIFDYQPPVVQAVARASSTSPVPVPASLPLLALGGLALAALRRRRR